MKWATATVGVTLIGLIGVGIIFLFQSVTTNNENDYYLLKEITQAAMFDSLDLAYYRETGDLKIVREKFVENFTRRYSESTIFNPSRYIIRSFDIMEVPPKVSITINTGFGYKVYEETSDYDISNKLDAILEYIGAKTNASYGSVYYDNPYDRKTFSNEYYAILNSGVNKFSLKTPGELIAPNIKNLAITGVNYIGPVSSQAELNNALMTMDISYYDMNINLDSDYYRQSINDFSSASINNTEYWNCGTGSTSSYNCTGDNKYYVTFNSNVRGGKAIIKYSVSWEYYEYEFAE